MLTSNTGNNTYACVCVCTVVESECPREAKRVMCESVNGRDDVSTSSSEAVQTATPTSSQSPCAQSSLARISLPLLSGSVEAQYQAQKTEEASTLVWNCDRLKCDEPLQLELPQSSKQRTAVECNRLSPPLTDNCKQTCRNIALIADYESSDSDEL